MSGEPEIQKNRWSNEPWTAKFATLPWWRKALCWLGFCQGVYDGSGWDGGWHCRHCWADWS